MYEWIMLGVGRDRDEVVGRLSVKHSFAVGLDSRSGVSASDLMIGPMRVPESMGVGILLGLLRRRGLQVAIVSDEHAGTAGVVTLEDKDVVDLTTPAAREPTLPGYLTTMAQQQACCSLRTSLRNASARCRLPPMHKFLRPFELPDRTGRRGRIPHGS
jgi:hypothetical protein